MKPQYTLEVKTVTIERTKIKQRLYILIGLDGQPLKILDTVNMNSHADVKRKVNDWCLRHVRNLNEKLRANSRNL